jgi:glutamine synthetase
MSLPVAPTVRLEVPDYDLGLRGKLEHPDKAAPGKRLSFCTIIYGLSVVDEVVDTPIGSAANGYPDAFAVPDEATRIAIPWVPGQQAVIADMEQGDGSPVLESPRAAVRRLAGEFAPFDLEPVFGYEYEVYITHAVTGAEPLRPIGRTINGYSLSRLAETQQISDLFLSRMQSIGIEIEMFHAEIGPGFYEFALAPAPPLVAADNAARAKQYFREVCAELGLRATFMAKVYGDRSGSGGHVHQSLNHNGRNVFSDGTGQLSPIGRNYVAGLLATMGEFSAATNPFVNSYKRLDPDLFVATRATWGLDTRNAACRAILNVSPAAARIENRRPGADANPYLVAAAMLAGGLHGLTNSLELERALEVGDDLATTGARLPNDLRTAITAFDESALVCKYFGSELTAAFSATRHAELAAFDKWWRNSVTDWELARYPDAL